MTTNTTGADRMREPRKTLLTEGAIEAGVRALIAETSSGGRVYGDATERKVKAIFHAMEAQLPNFVPAAQEPEASHDDFKESVGLMLDAVGYTTEYALRWPEEKVSITFKRWFDEQIAKAATPAAQTDDLAFQYASSLATAIFEKHFATDPDYTSGGAKWELCDSTAGILTQIDNMVSALVKPAAQTQEAGWQPIETVPKNGPRVLCWSWRGCAIFRPDDFAYPGASGLDGYTYWMPLPKPPDALAAQTTAEIALKAGALPGNGDMINPSTTKRRRK